MHEEMPRPVDGKMEGFQLWVNLPAHLKMSEPRYQEISNEMIPVVTHENGLTVRVIAGEYENTLGAVTQVAIQPVYLDINLCPGHEFEFSLPTNHTAFIYAYAGAYQIGDEKIGSPRLVILDTGECVRVETADKPARFLLIAGQPIGEPIARYGPFVMNTKAEIEEALDDLNKDTFIWSKKIKTL